MYKNIKAAVVGSINMDIILKADKIPQVGENLLGSQYAYANGGKGANQATALARLGAQTKMIGKVGSDVNGNNLIENLHRNNIDASGVSTEGSSTGLAAILIDGDGNNRIIVYEGANAEIETEEAIDSLGTDRDLLLVQFETNEDVVAGVVNHAVKNNIVTVIDCGPAKEFNLERMQGATIISPNESETFALTGVSPEDEESVLKASKILMARSKAKYVVLKLGSRGSSVWDGNTLTFIEPYKTTVVDTTAAGDCFTAAMALEYVKSGDIYAACRMGNKAGAIAVSRLGAADSMPVLEEVLSFGE